jgi:hypothetical protein
LWGLFCIAIDIRATYEYGGFVSVSAVEFDAEVVVVVAVVVEVALEPWEVDTAVTVPLPLEHRHFDCNSP